MENTLKELEKAVECYLDRLKQLYNSYQTISKKRVKRLHVRLHEVDELRRHGFSCS